MSRRIIFIIICTFCCFAKGYAQDYSVIQVKGECQMKEKNSWSDVNKGKVLHNDTQLKNKYQENGKVSIALKDKVEHNMYMINFLDSFHLKNLKVTDAPSRFSSVSVASIRQTSEREISSLATETMNPFRSGNGFIETDTPEFHIARAIRNMMTFKENELISISERTSSPMIALILSKYEDKKTLSAINLTEKKQYIFLMHINSEHMEIRTSGKLYEIGAMAECILESETSQLTEDEMTFAVATDKIIIPDNITLILSHMCDTDIKEYSPYQDSVGVSSLFILE